MSSKLIDGAAVSEDTAEGCEFTCPGEAGLCIPTRLICNGVVNCPTVADTTGGMYSLYLPIAYVWNILCRRQKTRVTIAA